MLIGSSYYYEIIIKPRHLRDEAYYESEWSDAADIMRSIVWRILRKGSDLMVTDIALNFPIQHALTSSEHTGDTAGTEGLDFSRNLSPVITVCRVKAFVVVTA